MRQRGKWHQLIHEVPINRVLQTRVVSAPPGGPVPLVATTDGVHFDRRPIPGEREALLGALAEEVDGEW